MGGVTSHLDRQRALSEQARDAHLRWLIEDLAIDLVLDVGANSGQFATSLRTQGYAGALASFEPAAGPRERLVAAAAGDDRWRVHPWALGEQEGTAVLHAVDEQSELGSLRPSSAFGRAWKDVMARTREEEVQVRRLDAVWCEVAGGAERALLKLDTQGFDLPAFRGAGALVEAGGPVVAVLSEVAVVPIYEGVPLMEEHLAAYTEKGWALAGLYPVSFDPPTLRVIELDAVLVRG
ncbi:FkbM family methyltransferase [Nocardioides sp. zg-579]|uniref:FkbM family methyltransferase n=1 Tax=Nocardioides marmotae TaxID=2663857 RepID=A0A6I3JA51_9ACTN|nr:FkbM family methyltransferase [Gordonia jinghuaiqii]MTB93485.1 FkbM family methyltransferase [Nocardioides marmotae]